MSSKNTFATQTTLEVKGNKYEIFSLEKLDKASFKINKLPFSLKILLENLLRNEDGQSVEAEDIKKLAGWNPKESKKEEIAFTPARVILQDFTGVPAVVDLAAMRDAMVALGGDASKIEPLLPSELVIDHSVQVDSFGKADSMQHNIQKEFHRNQERYVFLRWGQKAFESFKVVPPGTGIVHQVNLEYLARVVFDKQVNGKTYAYPDTLVGTDSHTTMINGIGVLGWGVGGIEAEAAMLGQAITLLIPPVIGVKLTGNLPEGTTATDLVLTVTETLRKKGVVAKFVEFYGDGLDNLSLANRATLSNMSPEFGSTCAIFPIDDKTLDYLRLSGRPQDRIDLVEAYTKAQGLFRTKNSPDPHFTDTVEINLNSVVPSLAGPKRPQDRVPLDKAKPMFAGTLATLLTSSKTDHSMNKNLDKLEDEGDPQTDSDKLAKEEEGSPLQASVETTIDGETFKLSHGSVVIAAITSCTNTSNPSVLIGAGLLAKNAVEKGLKVKPWVKTSLAPGSKVVTEYLTKSGLMQSLEALKFNLVGYGCTTCIGNSGPLPDPIRESIDKGNLVAVSVLSGNRNFEGRINPHVRANYLASPPLVVAYALAGKMDFDLYKEPLGQDKQGKNVFLKDIWPTQDEIFETVQNNVNNKMFREQYSDVFAGDKEWQELPVPKGDRFDWDGKSTYVRKPTFFDGMTKKPMATSDIVSARCLVKLGDSVTTDHISPAGSIAKDSPAGKYLMDNNVQPADFNSYGSRRGNHEVMIRGTFGNIRLRNQLAPGTEGGWTRYFPTQNQSEDKQWKSFAEGSTQMTIYEASLKYQQDQVPLIVLAGKEYGSGSSRDWAAKGTRLLGIGAVITESYERIHRSNLIGMGVLPLQFMDGENCETLGLTGEEVFRISGIVGGLEPDKILAVNAMSGHNKGKTFNVKTRIETPVELEYYKHGGILQYVLRQLL